MLHTVLLVVALVLFLLDALRVPSPRISLTSMGLAVYILSLLLP